MSEQMDLPGTNGGSEGGLRPDLVVIGQGKKLDPKSFDAALGGVEQAARIRSGPLRALVYGASKAGRTRFASTFPRPLFLLPPDEPGIETIAGMKGISYRTIEDKAAFDRTIDLIEEYGQAGTLPYATVVFDTILGLTQIVAAAIRKGGETDWLATMNYLKAVVRRISRFRCHVVMTALPKAEKDELTGELITGPLLPGQMILWLQQYCSAVLYIDKTVRRAGSEVKVERRLYVHGRGPWKAGIWDPTEIFETRDWIKPHYDDLAVPLGHPSLADYEPDLGSTPPVATGAPIVPPRGPDRSGGVVLKEKETAGPIVVRRPKPAR